MLQTSFRHLPTACVLAISACGHGSAQLKASSPLHPGDDACKTTIRTEAGTSTIRSVRDGRTLRAVVDLDGDGQPDEQRVTTLDGDGRVVSVERMTNGNVLLEREQRIYDGPRLAKKLVDRFDADGLPGVDGSPEAATVLTWEGERLVKEESDELAADGLPGVDGRPEFTTTWAWVDGKRTTGTRVDARDGAVLIVETLTWDHDHVAVRTIDLGGDGTVDVTFTNTWNGQRLSHVRIEGSLDPGEIEYGYCD